MGEVDVRGLLRPAARHRDVGGHAPRRSNISFDVRGGLLMRQMHHWAAMLFVASMMVHMLRVVLHRRVPQAARAQLGDRLPAAAARHPRGLHRLLAARRPALRHRHPRRRRLHEGDPGRRHLHVVLPLRRRVPRRVDHPAALHRPRAADPGPAARPDRRPHAAARLPQAHAVARPRPHRGERRRLPDAPGLHRQGRRLLLHRLRRHRPHGWPAVDQPGVEVRPLRPDEGDRRLAARLVHGLARRPAAHHARLGDGDLRLHDLVERHDPDPDRAADDAVPS